MKKKHVLLSVLLALALVLCPLVAWADEPDPATEPEPVGWTQIDGDWYYLDADGNVVTSDFVPYESYTLYVGADGRIRTGAGWFKLNGTWYYSTAKGVLYRNYWLYYGGHYYYFGDDCAVVANGWAYYGTKSYYMDASGHVSYGWVEIDGAWHYFGADGAQYFSRHAPNGYYIGADGTYDASVPRASWSWANGTYTWEEVSGVSRQSLVNYLTNNWKRYYGTPYSSSPCSIPGVGMHCAGFVARTFYDMGVASHFYARTPSYYVEPRNLGYLYKTNISSYTNENVWRVRGWLVWADVNNVRWIAYPDYASAVKGAARGEFQKGDILIYVGTASYIRNNVTMRHVCFYWGDSSNWSRVWESSPWGNGIYSKSYYGGKIIVLTSVR